MHHAVLTGLHLALFFGVRHQQVFGQAPVEEDADAVDLFDLEAGELADLQLGLFRGGDQLVFAVEVDKDVQPVFDLGGRVLGDVTVRQQDFAVRPTVQVQTEVCVLDHLQSVVTPN
ncbi:hypothetical protein D3C78_777710 [compost metagenome]